MIDNGECVTEVEQGFAVLCGLVRGGPGSIRGTPNLGAYVVGSGPSTPPNLRAPATKAKEASKMR
jgi:hypothetical protein